MICSARLKRLIINHPGKRVSPSKLSEKIIHFQRLNPTKTCFWEVEGMNGKLYKIQNAKAAQSIDFTDVEVTGRLLSSSSNSCKTFLYAH